MKYIIIALSSFMLPTISAAQNPGHVNAEVVFLNENSYFHQGFKTFGSINSTKPTSSGSTSLQLLAESEIYGSRIYGLATFDFNSDGRDDIAAYGRNGLETRQNRIWIFDIIGDHSLNNNFTKEIYLNNTKFSSLADDDYDINGITTGDFDGDGLKDDIAVIARRSSYGGF